MSSDSEDMSKPCKKRRCLIDETESDSDVDGSLIPKGHRNRRILKVVSDADDSSDDSDIGRPLRRVKGTKKTVIEDESDSESDTASLPLESDEAWQSDWTSTDSSDIEEVLPKKSRVFKNKNPIATSPSSSSTCSMAEPTTSNVAAGGSSDESDGQSEKCPICLLSFKKQQVASPSSCDHCFCLLCLTEWSKNVNTCPVDRQPFTSINVRFQYNGKIIRKIPVEPQNRPEELIQEDPTYCEVCRECDREDRMLLCDGCDLGYHLECLTPPMDEVPMDEWYCPRCSDANSNSQLADTIEIDVDELPDLMAEARCLGTTYGRTRSGVIQDSFPLPPLSRHHRLIPRTRQTERVRANIRAGRRRQEHRTFDPDQPSTSSGFESIYDSNSHNDVINSVIQRVSAAMSSTRKNRVKSSSKSTKRKRKTTSRKKSTTKCNDGVVIREVRIREINENGEEVENVTYVRVKPTSSGKRKKRSKRTRKV